MDLVSGRDYNRAMQGNGVVLVEIAAAPGSSATVLVDVRRADGGGGSLRAARASVDFSPDHGRNVQHAHLCVPVADREVFRVTIESFDVGLPRCTVSTYVWP